MSDFRRIAIIPARGGSKRLPRKNIARVCGRSVLDYTVEAAFKSGLFDRVIVSTEDDEIAQVAEEAGAESWERAANLSSDTTTMDEVVIDVLNVFHDRYGEYPTSFCCLLATAALRLPSDIINAFMLLKPGECDFVLAYKEYESSPHEALLLDESNGLSPMWPDLMRRTRWDRPRLVKDAGSIYWFNTKAFLKEGTFFGANLRGYLLPNDRAVDLDEPADLELMEYYMRRRIQSNG